MSGWTAAAVDRLTAAGIARAYTFGGVPQSPAYPYLVVSALRVTPVTASLNGGHDLATWRVTTQAFGRTKAAVDSLDGIAFDALQDQQLVDAITCGPCDLQVSAETRDPDDSGVIGITSSYLFQITRERP